MKPLRDFLTWHPLLVLVLATGLVLAAAAPEPVLVLELMAQGLLSRSHAAEKKMAGGGRGWSPEENES